MSKNNYVTRAGFFICMSLSVLLASMAGLAVDSKESSNTVESSAESTKVNEDGDTKSDSDESKTDTSSAQQDSNAVPYSYVEDLLSEEVKTLLSPVAEESWDQLSDVLLKLNQFVGFDKNHVLITEDKKILTELILLQETKEQEILKEEALLDELNEIIKQRSLQLESIERGKYDDSTYNSLTTDSQNFKSVGKKTDLFLPRQVVLMGQNFKLKKAPIKYDGHVLISLDDVLQYVNADVQETKESGTISLQSEKMLLEMTKGENLAYVNDKSSNVEVPVLYFNDCTYISAEFFARSYGISYKCIDEVGIMIMYGDVNL